jgi:prepilin-type N-terminal cleavage/methylation domain-containing protein
MNMVPAQHSRGFTLIELLVVIAIIGMLSSVVLASLNSARAKARDSRRAADLQSIRVALELYYDANGSYPNPGWAWRSQCVGWGSHALANVIPGLTPTYMPVMPQDPAMVTASNQNCYLYLSNGTDYKVLDYNIVDSPNPGALPNLVDPSRNYGQAYPRPAGCTGSTEATRSFAIYSSSNSMCW